MTQRSRTISATLVMVSFAIGLSGCAPAAELVVFSREQTSSDELPSSGTSNVVESVDSDSTRLLWENDEASFFAAKGSGQSSDSTCLVIFQGDESVSGCSPGLPVSVQMGDMPEYLLGDLPGSSDRWTKVADYLFVDSDE